MLRFAISSDDGLGHRLRRREGIALVATLLILVIVSAIGLGLSLITGLEPAAAANYECAWRARYAAEAGAMAAVHDLVADGEWAAALAGRWRPAHLAAVPAEIALPDGTHVGAAALTNLANCGHEASCSDAELEGFTAERPWGPNNPRWQIAGMLRLEGLQPATPGIPDAVVIVWVGDDPAELDGDPLRDSEPAADGTRVPGSCVVAIRAEAFSVRAGHRSVTATVARPGAGCGPEAFLVSWRTTP
jgi:hypothetical protein